MVHEFSTFPEKLFGNGANGQEKEADLFIGICQNVLTKFIRRWPKLLKLLLLSSGKHSPWGTQRIAINLQTPSPYIVTLLESVTGTPWVPVTLSRQTVNEVLKKHQLNRSPYKNKRDWKYFRAIQPDEMWQIDLRGPIRIDDLRGYVLVILDDYSRYLISCRFYEHITTETVLTVIQEIHQNQTSISSENIGR